MRSPRSRFALILGLVATTLALTIGVLSCSHDSYLVVLLKSPTGTTLTGVTKVVVNVKDASGLPMVTRTFPAKDITIDATTGQRFSLSFSPDRSGQVLLSINVTAAGGCSTGGGAAVISKGDIAYAAVTLSAPTACALPPADAGVDGKNTFAGCDPAVANSCGPNQTCSIDCANKIGACVPGGTKGPGVVCASNSDCMPGTQCFDYGCATPTKVCLKFCANEADCAAPTILGVPATCSDPVVCLEGVTSYKTCGFQCDPRGAGNIGCPTGLGCFLFKNPAGGEDSPACACPSASRVGQDGATCVLSSDCAPGFLCDQMGGGQFCRRICKMSSPTDCPTTPVKQTCEALLNNTVYGVCL